MDKAKIYQDLENIILHYCNVYKINILPDRYKTAVGRAWLESKDIKIPHIDSIEDFFVCLHEIGHIATIDKVDSNSPEYIFEYNADKWALDTGRKHGIDSNKYLHRAKWYVLSFIAEHHNKNENYNIPKKILNFIEEDISTWKGYEIKVYFTSSELTIKKKLLK